MKQTMISVKNVKVSLCQSTNFRLIFILLFGFFCATTNIYAQDTQITLSARNTPVREVLKMIEAKSDYHFAYNNKLIDVTRKVDVIATNEKISDILKKIFVNTDITFKVLDHQIILASAKEMGGSISKTSSDKVSGKITDENGQPLPGVSVLVKGTKQATITDDNGSYVINNIPKNSILQFSFIGMLTYEVKVGSQSIINAALQDASKGLSEIIVVGYGTTTKKGLVSAVASVKPEDLNKGAITDVGQLIRI